MKGLMLIALVLGGCAFGHPGEQYPDAVVNWAGHEMFGFRVNTMGRKGKASAYFKHSYTCPHPSHKGKPVDDTLSWTHEQMTIYKEGPP